MALGLILSFCCIEGSCEKVQWLISHRHTRTVFNATGADGGLAASAPLPLLLACLGESAAPETWRLAIGFLSMLGFFAFAFQLGRHPVAAKKIGMGAVIGSFFSAGPYLLASPFAALLGCIILIRVGFTFWDFTPRDVAPRDFAHKVKSSRRALYAAGCVLCLLGIYHLLGISDGLVPWLALATSVIAAQVFMVLWAKNTGFPWYFPLTLSGILVQVMALRVWGPQAIPAFATLFSLVAIALLPRGNPKSERREAWWQTILNHPARVLFATFFLLCLLGTALLLFPWATTKGGISPIDAAFTSVSAVCITGLIVLDTPNDFTLLGQGAILLLIQLGGLGIMSIATIALYIIGRRLSLEQERLLTTLTDTDSQGLLISLKGILRLTFLVEGVGGIFLAGLFFANGDSLFTAIWRGCFTAISAFCNAGFALQSDSLIPYRMNSFILHTIAVLIVLGGLAPATSLCFSHWLKGKSVPINSRIALIATTVLLFGGMLFILAFEWNGVLSGLSPWGKLQNAWFQSVTLRTAGFNSVDLAGIANQTFLLMIGFMFIGGSPGGTAGGVKTTTIAILMMTFWASISNQQDIVSQSRRITHYTVFQAITIVISGMIIWFFTVMMLEITQEIPIRDLIFEATSALGTVGLSTGATAKLDEIGKIIIMVAMFAGRIGPMTLFMFLSDSQPHKTSRCPDARISIT